MNAYYNNNHHYPKTVPGSSVDCAARLFHPYTITNIINEENVVRHTHNLMHYNART